MFDYEVYKERHMPDLRGDNGKTSLGKHLMETRSQNYAHPSVNFPRIAKVWEGITGREYTAYEVGIMLLGLKLARLTHGFHQDSLDDIEGYVECLRAIHND